MSTTALQTIAIAAGTMMVVVVVVDDEGVVPKTCFPLYLLESLVSDSALEEWRDCDFCGDFPTVGS